MSLSGADADFVFNGVDATSGRYLLPPLSSAALTDIARGLVPDEAHVKELERRHRQATEATFAPKEGVDPKNLAETGWGVIFAHGADPAVREALSELLDHRRRQASAVSEGRYREFTGPDAYRPGESKQQFLARHGAGPGPVEPDVVPYYLLIVGDPSAIPYDVQYRLDVQYAVGRIHFDRPEEYANYARTVVACETGQVALDRRAAFFATKNGEDRATALSAEQLVGPLAEVIAGENDDWSVESFIGEVATKGRLLDLLGGAQTPALLFTATHGAGFPSGHPLQLAHQGALVCQDWPGPSRRPAPLSPDQYLSGGDLGDDARLLGLITFHFACFGAGTPQRDGFSHAVPGVPPELAAQPFVAALPKRALAHPRGGALAEVGHVDRAWGYSFSWPQVGRQTEVYRSCLKRLLDGHPVGSAFEYFNERYAELSTELNALLEDIKFGLVPDPLAVSALWTANNDARGFAVIGDPAVRLPLRAAQDQERAAPVAVVPGDRRRELPSIEGAAVPTVVVDRASEPAPDVGGPDVDHEPVSGRKDARGQLEGALRGVAETLGSTLQRIAEELSVLEIATYVSDDPSVARFDVGTGRFSGADLKVLTRIAVDGNAAAVVVAPPAGEEGDALWNLHVRMVEQARAARTEVLAAAASALAALSDALKVL